MVLKQEGIVNLLGATFSHGFLCNSEHLWQQDVYVGLSTEFVFIALKCIYFLIVFGQQRTSMTQRNKIHWALAIHTILVSRIN